MRFELPVVEASAGPGPHLEVGSEALGTAVGKILAAKGLGGYEPETIGAALAVVSSERTRTFVDVGANIGIFSLVLKGVFGESLRVHAHEPLPRLMAICESLARENGLEVNCSARALADQSGTANFYVSAKSDSSNSLNPSFRPSKEVIRVEQATADQLYGAGEAGGWLFKVDTESTEPDVLRGAGEMIRRHRPWIICEVLHGRREDRLQQIVDEHGYHAYHLRGGPLRTTEPIIGDPEYLHRDWLFAPVPVGEDFNRQYVQWQSALARTVHG